MKGSASSNSSDIKDLHAGAHSGNSSSDKSDQRQFDRLIKRNNIPIQEMYCNQTPDQSKSSNNLLGSAENRKNSTFKKVDFSTPHVQEFNSLNSTPEAIIKLINPTLKLSSNSDKKHFKNPIEIISK